MLLHKETEQKGLEKRVRRENENDEVLKYIHLKEV